MSGAISRRRFVAGLLATPVVAACGGGGDDGAAPTTAGDTSLPAATPPEVPTTAAPPTTPAPPPPGLAPLTGLLVDPVLVARPALVVKIDNADGPGGRGRPQAGLNQADVVFEEMVEGSVTRFATVFHSTDAPSVGPVRSGRDTDIEIFSSLNRPLFAWSGGNAIVSERIRSSPIIDVGVDVASGAYRRLRERRAPYNLYSGTPELFALAPADAVPPPALFQYRALGEPAAGSPATGVSVQYRNPDGVVAALAEVHHRWDPNTGGWPRSQRGTPHVDADGNVVQPANVVVQLVEYFATGGADSAGNRVFQARLVGEGEAWVFTGGNRIDGRWSKSSPEAVTAFHDSTGQPIRLTPGRTWVLLSPLGGARPL